MICITIPFITPQISKSPGPPLPSQNTPYRYTYHKNDNNNSNGKHSDLMIGKKRNYSEFHISNVNTELSTTYNNRNNNNNNNNSRNISPNNGYKNRSTSINSDFSDSNNQEFGPYSRKQELRGIEARKLESQNKIHFQIIKNNKKNNSLIKLLQK